MTRFRARYDSAEENRMSRWAPLAVLLLVVSAGCTILKLWDYEGFNRDEWQQPQRVIHSLGIQAGYHVADLGSGSGYFTLRLAEAAGPEGKVYAVDVDSSMNEYVEKRCREKGYENVEVILAKYHDPLLPKSSVELIFACNTYHHIEDRVTYFQNARKYLRRQGLVAIIDYNGRGWFERLLGHWIPRGEIEAEMMEAGYRLHREFTFLEEQHFMVFSVDMQEQDYRERGVLVE